MNFGDLIKATVDCLKQSKHLVGLARRAPACETVNTKKASEHMLHNDQNVLPIVVVLTQRYQRKEPRLLEINQPWAKICSDRHPRAPCQRHSDRHWPESS